MISLSIKTEQRIRLGTRPRRSTKVMGIQNYYMQGIESAEMEIYRLIAQGTRVVDSEE
jgi:hypothetical protein